jgi:hypothetical protein
MIVKLYDGTEIETDEYGWPMPTDSGPKCGNCRERHAGAKAIRLCYDTSKAEADQAHAEHAAEMAVERYYEDRGYWDARAQEDYEAAHGVIPFDVAYAEALGLDVDAMVGAEYDR